MKWSIAADHGGVNLKAALVAYLEELGHTVADYGAFDPKADDNYSDYADKVAQDIVSGTAEMGLLVCGSGVGVSMRANRYPQVRAALVYNEFIARSSRQHNNANVLCFGERVITPHMAKLCLKAFLDATYEGGRHDKRVRALCTPVE